MARTDYMSIPPIRDAFYEYTRSYNNWGSDYSITGLLRPPREIMLTQRYREAIDAMPFDHDAIDKQIKSFMGTAIHNHLEFMLKCHVRNNPQKGYLMEQRIWDRINGRKISGKFDVMLNGALYDYKTCSVWKKIMNAWDDYEAQLNLYDYMLGTCGREVSVLFIIAWYTDWTQLEQWKNPDYPKTRIEQLHISNKWAKSTQEQYLWDRIDAMKRNEDLPDNELEFCTAKETWEKPTIYAVKRPGQAKAVAAKGLTSHKKAEDYIRNAKQKDKDTFFIEKRGAARTKCDQFCKAAPFCNQYKEYCAEREAA